MELPAIVLPKIELPFDVPVLLHPSVDHFAIALPIIILLLEFYNLFARKKTVGGFSFILIVLTVIAFAAAYFTGLVDGKESYDLLSLEGKEELKAHKLLGTYLLIGSAALLFFKLLAMTGKGFFKFLFFVVLIGFTIVTLEQGKEGGELVYEHGANVERVKTLDDELFDANEALEEAQEELNASKAIIEKVPVKVEVPAVSIPTPATNEAEVTPEVTTPTIELPTPESTDGVNNLLESVKEEMKTANDNALSSLEKSADEVMEVVPSDIERPKIETH